MLIATTLSRIIINVWFDPLIIHKYGFHYTIKPFILSYARRISEFFLILIILLGFKKYCFPQNFTFGHFVIMILTTFFTCIVGFWLCNHKRDEYAYMITFLKGVQKKIKSIYLGKR